MSPKGKLKIIPLGGVEEIGKNIYVLEYADNIVILDCGSIFPKEDMLGIDLVIPDVTYLQRNRDKIRGILVTHGHEDHIGAIPYVVKQLGGVVPIYEPCPTSRCTPLFPVRRKRSARLTWTSSR